MNAKEKAIELVEKFMKQQPIHITMQKASAKQCALIAVDEIIEEVRDYCDYNYSFDRMKFWQQVKESIKTIEI